MSGDAKVGDTHFTFQNHVSLPQDQRRRELIDGYFYLTSAPSSFHQTISRRLQFSLMTSLEKNGLAVIFGAPIYVLLADSSVVQPDLAVVRSSRKEVITDRGIEGVPDLIVEITSQATHQIDDQLKRNLYARFGIGEYWIVDPAASSIDVLQLSGKSYKSAGRFTETSVLSSKAFEQVHIPLEPIFQPI